MKRREHEGVSGARAIAVRVVCIEVVVLAITGLWLYFYYRPSPSSGWFKAIPAVHHSGIAEVIRAVHEWIAIAALVSSLAAGFLITVDSRAGSRRFKVPVRLAGAGLVVVVAGALFTGRLLPWDQLALWAAPSSPHLDGFRAAFGSQVRFVLINGTEVTRRTLWWWFIVHAVVLSAATCLVLLVAWQPPRPAPIDTPAPTF